MPEPTQQPLSPPPPYRHTESNTANEHAESDRNDNEAPSYRQTILNTANYNMESDRNRVEGNHFEAPDLDHLTLSSFLFLVANMQESSLAGSVDDPCVRFRFLDHAAVCLSHCADS